METINKLRREMSEDKLTELEHWKIRAIASDTLALNLESNAIKLESMLRMKRKLELELELKDKQEEKNLAIKEILERVGSYGTDIEFELVLTNDPKCSIIRHN